MRKVVKFVVLLPVRIILLPVEMALILITWIAIFFTGMSAWIFNTVAFMLFTLALFCGITGGMSTGEFLKCMGTAFVVFIIPFVAEWVIMRIVDLRCIVWEIITM